MVDGVILRVRAVDLAGRPKRDDRGYRDVPVSGPLSDLEIAHPSPPWRCGSVTAGPASGRIREYFPSDNRHRRPPSRRCRGADSRRTIWEERHGVTSTVNSGQGELPYNSSTVLANPKPGKIDGVKDWCG